ncbi:beta-1,3-glucanase family protein [Jidongwangia harbinensis]|uniref:beta-1,3-glucanase family protein n=1 Tax=Jidongwangia harbinensis TaxID=2878561 RepID=UPI001CD93414|nr:beta-1,3-glucanase family protein [Jidongwangia harbinensis]MCA2211848.1 beta-1,3-glucanase family protein [Jidongwangia harbinensis]
MPTRRTFLSLAAAGTAAGVPLIASAFYARADAGDGLPLVVENNTGRFENQAITMYVLGTAGGQQGFVKESGVFTPVSSAAGGADGSVDIGVPLAGSGSTSFVLPTMESGRIYFAIDGKLTFRVVTDGAGKAALQYPVAWVESDPNFAVLHDCCEFTYDGTTVNLNTTMVDMFSIPMSIRVEGGDGQAVAGVPTAGGRDAIFAEMERQPDFKGLVVGDRLRILAPSYGIETKRFRADYFDGYIGEIWERYATTDLRVKTVAGSFTGRVVDGKLTFDGGVRAFDRPSTIDVLKCNGALDAPNDGRSGPVAAVLAAGFNRSVLGQADQPVADRAAHYQHPVTNHYSRILHAHSGDGLAYGFPFDDVADQAPFVRNTAPTQMRITLAPFGDGPVPAPAGGPSQAPPAPPEALAAGAVVAAGGARGGKGRIAADSFTAQSGIKTEDCAEGGKNIGYIAHGDRASYGKVDFGGEAATQFRMRVASGAAGGVSGLIEVRIGDPGSTPVGAIAVASTGGWQSWQTVPGSMAPVTGVHDVHLTFTSGQPQEFVNVSWFEFS